MQSSFLYLIAWSFRTIKRRSFTVRTKRKGFAPPCLSTPPCISPRPFSMSDCPLTCLITHAHASNHLTTSAHPTISTHLSIPAYFSTSNQPSSHPSMSVQYVHLHNNFCPPLRSSDCFRSPIHFCSLQHSCSLLGIPITFHPPLHVCALPPITPPIACPLLHTPPLIHPIPCTPRSLFAHIVPPFCSLIIILYITRRPTLTPDHTLRAS